MESIILKTMQTERLIRLIYPKVYSYYTEYSKNSQRIGQNVPRDFSSFGVLKIFKNDVCFIKCYISTFNLFKTFVTIRHNPFFILLYTPKIRNNSFFFKIALMYVRNVLSISNFSRFFLQQFGTF